jgi:TPR repeat protein
VQAAKWYRLSAEQGDRDAQFRLGLMYLESKGVPQDYVQAHFWLNLAVSQASASWKKRDVAVALREHAASKMTPAQVAEAQKLAREWKPE